MKQKKGSELLRLKKSTVSSLNGFEMTILQGGNTYQILDNWTACKGSLCDCFNDEYEYLRAADTVWCSIRTRPQ